MKIIWLDTASVGDTSLSPLTECGEFTAYEESTAAQALERVADCEVLIINKVVVDRALLAAAPELRLVCEAATGVNNIDLEACKERGIPVRNVAGYSTESVVQATFMHLLSLAGNAPYYDNCVKTGTYSSGTLFTNLDRPITELYGKTLGIIGMGTIGSRVAAVGEAFGMKIIYYSTSGTGHCKTYPSVPIDELMAVSDVISVHAPLNERTRGLVDERRLRLMKPGAYILNAGRGGIIDEAALARIIDEGAIGGAGLDVYEKEPLPATSPLLHTRHPELLRFTPHTAWASAEARARLIEEIAENIKMGY